MVPLAADLRTDETKITRKKRRVAILKLIAAILGLELDELLKRDEERRRRSAIIVAVLVCVLVAGISLGTTYLLRTNRLVEAKSLAQKSLETVEAKPIRGLLLAALALKKNIEAKKEADPSVVQAVLMAMRHTDGTPLLGHTSAVKALKFSSDETWLVSADFGGRLGFWDLRQAPPAVTWKETGGKRILALDSSAGRWLVAGAEGLVTICDLKAPGGITCSALARPEGQVFSVVFSPNGEWLAVGGMDSRVHVWRHAADGGFHAVAELVTELPVIALRWSPSSEWLAASTAFTDLPQEREEFNRIVLWNFTGGAPDSKRFELPESAASWAMQFSPDNKLLIAGDLVGRLRFWDMTKIDVTTKPEVSQIKSSSFSSLAFGKDPNWFVSGEDDGTVKIWNLEKQPAIAEATSLNKYITGQLKSIYSIAISPNESVALGSWLPVTWQGQHIYSSEQVHRIGGHESPVTAVAYSPSGTLLATSDSSGAVRLHDAQGGFDGSCEWSSDASATMSRNGAWLASANKPPRLYGAGDHFRRARQLPNFEARVLKLAFSPNSEMLVGLGDDGSARCWFLGKNGVESSQSLKSVGRRRYSLSAMQVAFNNTGRVFATSGDDGTGYVWKCEGHTVLPVGSVSHRESNPWSARPQRDFGDQIYAMRFSHDSRWLATGSENGALKVWDLKSDRKDDASILPLAYQENAHPGGVSNIEFLKGDTWLATSGADGKLIIRDWGLRKVIVAHDAFKGFVTAMSLDPNEQWLAAGGGYIPQPFGSGILEYDSRVMLWEVSLIKGKPTTLPGLKGTVGALAFYPRRNLLVGGGENEIRFWQISVDNIKALPTILQCPGVNTLLLSDNGRYCLLRDPGAPGCGALLRKIS